MRALKSFDVSLQTVYAQAKELALAQRQIPLSTPGTLQVEARGDRRFVYRYRYGADGERVTEYLGPEGEDATRAKVDEAVAEIRDAELLADYSRDLRRVTYYAADNSTLITVAALFNAGIFSGGGVLVGTHAFGALCNELAIRGGAIPRTEDVDIGRAARIELAGSPKRQLLALLRETGLPFLAVPLKRHEPATSFKLRGQKLEVDLLVPRRASVTPYATVAVPELGAHATALPHFRYLLDGASESVLLGRDRIVPVLVPNAGRFCLHKLAVYSLRHDSAKRAKDLEQAVVLVAALATQHEFWLADAVRGLDRALKREIKPGAKRAIEMLAAFPDAVSALKSLV